LTLAAAGLAVAALPASAASTDVLRYSGTETSGTLAIDRSGSGNSGTLHNVQLTGSGYAFNGQSSYISVPASASLNPGTANFSYGVTMSLPAGYTFTHDLSLVRRGASKLSGAYYKLELVYKKSTGNTHLECAMRDSAGKTGYVSVGAAGLNDGAWHTLTCSKTGSTVSLTKNGNVYAKAASLGSFSTTRALNFGAEQVTDTSFWEHYIGKMKDIFQTRG
jgi:hypothetical protein